MSEQVSFEILSEQGAPANEYSSLVGTEREKKQGCLATARPSVVLASALILFLGSASLGYLLQHQSEAPNASPSTEDGLGEVGSSALLNCPNHLFDLTGDDNDLAFKVCATADYPLGSICQWTCKNPDMDGLRNIRSLNCVNYARVTDVPIVDWIETSEYPGATVPYSHFLCPEAPCSALVFDQAGNGAPTTVSGLTCDGTPDANGFYPSGSTCSFACGNGGAVVTASCTKAIWTTSQQTCAAVPPQAVQCGAGVVTLQDGTNLPGYPGTQANAQNRPDQKMGLYRVEWAADNTNFDLEKMGECARIADDVPVIDPTTGQQQQVPVLDALGNPVTEPVLDAVTGLPVVDPTTGLPITRVVTEPLFAPGTPDQIPIQIVKATVTVTTPVGSFKVNFPHTLINARYAADPDLTLPATITTVNPATADTFDVIWPGYDPTHPICGGPLVQPCAPIIAVGLFGFHGLTDPISGNPWWPVPGTVVSFSVQMTIKSNNDPRLYTYTSASGDIISDIFVYGGGINGEQLVIRADPCNTGPDPRDVVPGLVCPPPQTGPVVQPATPPPGVAYVDGANPNPNPLPVVP